MSLELHYTASHIDRRADANCFMQIRICMVKLRLFCWSDHIPYAYGDRGKPFPCFGISKIPTEIFRGCILFSIKTTRFDNTNHIV